MKKYRLITLFCIGFIFRLWLIFLSPQAGIFDQAQYDKYAKNMLNYGLYAHSFRIYGYPLFVAFIYKLTGILNTASSLPWQLVQALLDTFTAVFIYFTAKRIFQITRIAILAFILYLFNPFTSTYAGVLLPEVLTIFLVALLFFLLSFSFKTLSVWKLVSLGVILGYLTQVRPFYFYYSLVGIFILAAVCFRKIKDLKVKAASIIVLLVFYFLPFIYNIWGNWTYFREFALMDVDNLFVENFYISLFLENSPDVKLSYWDYPSEVRWAFAEYSYSPDPMDKAGRAKKRQTFINASLEEIKKDPYKFLSWRVKKLWYAWEKHTLYPYTNPQNKLLLSLVYWTNVAVLLSALVGIIYFGKKIIKNDLSHKLFLVFSVLLFLNTSAVGAATSAQERYSLPAYPVVFIFCAVGLWVIGKRIRKIFCTLVSHARPAGYR